MAQLRLTPADRTVLAALLTEKLTTELARVEGDRGMMSLKDLRLALLQLEDLETLRDKFVAASQDDTPEPA